MTAKKTRNLRTENQIVLTIGDENKFYDFLEKADPSYLAKCHEIYKNEHMIYIAFEFDGTPNENVLWKKVMGNTPYIIETNYLNGELPWTRDYTGGEYDLTFAWQIIQGQLFPEIRDKYENQGDIFNDPIFLGGSPIEYSNQEEIDGQELTKIVGEPEGIVYDFR